MKKSTIVHLRFPFSFFLLPVFLFAAACLPETDWLKLALIFVLLHFFLYPASNGYNSYYDKDEGSIGGVKVPPKVTKELYYVSWVMDVIAIVIGLVLSWQFAAMMLVYGLVSKAYSHPSIRLKKRPIIGWLTAGVFQGYFTFMMVCVGMGYQSLLFSPMLQWAGLLSTLLLFGSYPMTQVYQHEEDARRGDITLSLILGVLDTFHFTAVCFSISMALFYWFFTTYFSFTMALLFLVSLSPVLIYFGYWYLQVRRSQEQANFENTMRLNLVSSACLNAFFTWLLLY
ncbi:UbiA family prenyltransferase [Marinoscillum sp.]|uniref:UbiA family prenyltransferase n=1 Tax=Marinoscillum sp. TaxID=2024838 RepID=UPI003BAB2771